MKDLSAVSHHPTSERLVQVLMNKTQSADPLFFRVLVAYYLAKVAGTMRPIIRTLDRGDIPVNLYAINLAPSGFSKGYSTNLIENQVIHKFKRQFMQTTFPLIGEASLATIAVERANRKGTDPDEERDKVNTEFTKLGNFLFSFSEGTSPAVKQMRHKLLMANCGAVNLEMDEIGSNLIANTEILNTFLELYDVGRVKQKLTKNTAENTRNEDIDGITPTNMMLFGTPDKLLDAGKTEDEFMSFLSTGYGRRCLFGYIRVAKTDTELTPEQILKMRTSKTNETFLETIADQLEVLAEPQNHGKRLLIDEAVTLKIIEYELHCKKLADEMPRSADIHRAEMTHRYFKALKLAGTYAFIDGSTHITENHFYQAVKLVEESGKALHGILKRDPNHVKLAKHLADLEDGKEVTHAELAEQLPFFKGSAAVRTDMITMATAWGYKNNIVIQKSFMSGIEVLSAESLKHTDLDEMIFSYSDDVAYGYYNDKQPFDELHQLTQAQGMHWCAHHVDRGHRCDSNIIPGFNMVVIDVDNGVSLDTAKLLLKDYKCLYYTTKRHQTDGEDRFRIIFPTNYILKLDTDDYKEFMKNVYSWLPFSVDDSTSDRPRKWLSHDGHFEHNDGELLDVLPFIPKTTKEEERKQTLNKLEKLDNLERWFVSNTGKGNRSNQLIKFALMLVDSGRDYEEIYKAVSDLNQKLPTPMQDAEIQVTIMRTVGSRLSKRE